MNVMSDALTVLGSRIGLCWNPVEKICYLIRHKDIKGLPFGISAGLVLDDKEVYLPLCSQGKKFEFVDQESTPTTMKLSGIDPSTGLHVKLTVRIPFRPRDNEFSTIPAFFIDLEVDRMSSNFRWTAQKKDKIKGKLVISIKGDGFKITPSANGAVVTYQSGVSRPKVDDNSLLVQDGNLVEEKIDCTDKIALIEGEWKDGVIEMPFNLDIGYKGPRISLAWCVYDKPVLNVLGNLCPFKYTSQFKDLDSVAQWAIQNVETVRDNSQKVDGILMKHNLGESVNHLMAVTLHSWLYCSWWVLRPDGKDWFSVWEGSCYFHSTVDVEYTQSPFYLTVWPELLEYQLDEWPLFGKDGASYLGERGKDTLFLSHDMGLLADATHQFYPHEMEVEESANYVIMAYCHWRRTGNDRIIKKHAPFIRKLMDFIVACDTTGNGIVDKGCANTIDDASPAIQFGTEQIYLGVKAMTACKTGKEILDAVGGYKTASYAAFVKKAAKTIESKGWKNDHYVVTLNEKVDGLKNPWTGEIMNGELEGWDAYHIYTSNGLALTAMVGLESGLDRRRLALDIKTGMEMTLMRYGCRHTSYVNTKPPELNIPGLASIASKVGWVSMNMLRDIAGAYLNKDLFELSDRYWDWQAVTNTQGVYLFFETFYGNNLNLYPRGIAVFGYFDAAAGFIYDAVKGVNKTNPVRRDLDVPLLLFADWKKGTVPHNKK